MVSPTWISLAAGALVLLAAGSVFATTSGDDARAVADLDREFQAAVKRNDVQTIGRILLDDFVLVTGTGKVYQKSDILKEAETKEMVFEQQDEEAGTQTVRVWGDTAVVTAKLWVKGTRNGAPVDRKVWFSDTYVRTPSGWRYAFGQASLALPSGS